MLRRSLNKRDVNFFLAILVFSLVGNVCADYALLWYGLSLLDAGNASFGGSALSHFYVGQAIGVVLLSPLLAVIFDKSSRLISSITLDACYACILVVAVILYRENVLNSKIIFLFSLATAALSILHKSSVGMAVIQRMSEITGISDISSRFIIALNVPFLIGSVLSGFVFQNFGFEGCMVVGVLTFLPAPLVYWRVFGGDGSRTANSSGFLENLKQGFLALKQDRLITGTVASIAILNIASAVLPAIVGYSYLKYFPGRTDYASIAISVSILGGILLTKAVGEYSKKLPINMLVPLSLIPTAILLITCFFFPHPFLFTAMFLLSCVGSAARNVSSTGLRVCRIPKNLIGRVNTVYSAALYLGQSIGGIVVVGAVQYSLSAAIVTIIGTYLFSSFISLYTLPRDRVGSFLEEAK